MNRFFNRIIHKICVIVRWATIIISRIVKFLTTDMWTLNMDDLSRWKARLIRDLKTVFVTLTTFTEQKIGFQVTALAYQCTMAFVPMLAIAFFITSRVGLSDYLDSFIRSNIEDERILGVLLNAAGNIVNTAQSGLFGAISMLSFVWVVIWLMMTVARVFNNVWKVKKQRNFFKQFFVVIGIIILAPFMLLMFSLTSIVYSNVLNLILPDTLIASSSIRSFVGWLIFAALSILVISAMYKYIPACRVRYCFAFKAAVYAGIAFTALQYLYIETQVMVTKQSAIYGAIAALPLFMIWLNFGWTIILYGAELSYAFQNVDRYNVSSAELDEFGRSSIEKRRSHRQLEDMMHNVNSQRRAQLREEENKKKTKI